ncbi:3-deoxy-7-phosphoheptulonate synthase [Streptomyces sp. NRRL S-1022]|uniref:3-deoxy-7-phosphoheptulonate synthase n=1 Tax=Streptomyces sp. NRRL S-1022 TaxID=1463880 RepID=UPI00099BA90A|nr:3-deoxy-7-phosphoheptulonate synthase class II [Streptomyces sp. NRRL S-1022]
MTYFPRWPPGTPGRIRRRAVERILADRLEAALARPAAQQPGWPDPDRARAVVRRLTAGEPLVTPAETRRLLDRLGAVARGEALLLQSGDCAETFAETTEPHLRANLGLLRRMALVLTHGAGLPVVTVARAAGQYAKPRSAAVGADGLPVYRGDIVNSGEATPAARTPDPERMARAHAHAREAMTVVRRLSRGDLADAHALHEENRQFVSTAPGGRPHTARAAEIGRGLRFMTGIGAPAPRLGEIWTSHEALLLDYERTQLWIDTEGPEPRLSSGLAHFLWIGERTRHPDGAHIAFAELLANPIGVKIGPGTTPEQAVEYVRRLDPHGVPGRLTLITRMGHDRVREALPPIVEKVTASGRQVIWQCDPMHGNSRTTAAGYKVRRYEHILDEITGFLEVHRALGTHPGGLHLEATGEDVTECTGGARGLTDEDLPARYRTACDPRLNAEQSMELAFTVAELFATRAARSTEARR